MRSRGIYLLCASILTISQIRRKSQIIVDTRCHLSKAKYTKFDFAYVSAPDPAGELTEERREEKRRK